MGKRGKCMNASGTRGLDYSNKGAKLGVSERAGRQEGGSRLLGVEEVGL